jgi:ABC-type multidrug transport system fused ATPase/permease subunit
MKSKPEEASHDYDRVKVMNDGAAEEAAAGVEKKETIVPVPFLALFRFGNTSDIVLMGIGIILQVAVGCSMAAVNILFGEIIDDLAAPGGSVAVAIKPFVMLLVYFAVGFGVSAFFGMTLIPYSASRITNNVRIEYMKAVLRQDMDFFDQSKPGEVVSLVSSATLDFEEGISVKLGEGLQGTAALVSGFVVAFYFSWQISLACLVAVPLMGVSFHTMLTAGAGSDGVLGNEAYEKSANVADETLSSMQTVVSFTGEINASNLYERHLQDAEDAAIRQSKKLGFGTGMLWASFFLMMGLAFFWGGKLVVESTEKAMIDHPFPPEFYTAPEYQNSYAFAQEACVYRPVGSFGKGDLLMYEQEAFEVCACNIPWDVVDFKNPLCGCGKGAAALSSNSECVTAGTTIVTFFCVMMAGFMIAMIPPAIEAISKARLAAASLYKVIDRKPKIDSSVNATGKKLEKIKGAITIENLHFQYPTGANKIFNDINLDIKAGETIALVGESGSGKSTIARLVSRFYDPQEGSLKIDGVDLKDLHLVSLRDKIGLVSQEPLLFDLTIEENISRGKPGGATRDEVIAAAKAANAYDYIMKFPEQFNTMVGARGSKLSGGQKQRIAIARALVRKPAILILDEATSALDNESEKIVQAAIDKLISHDDEDGVGGMNTSITTIIIAHRLSTVRNADRIVVLGAADGTTSTASSGSTIVEIGSHEELMAKEKGLYKALVGGSSDTSENSKSNSYDNTKTNDNYPSTSDTLQAVLPESSPAKAKGEEKKKDDPQDEERTVNTEEGKKLKAKKDEEEFKLVDQKRLWAYTAPERLHFIGGLVACFFNGTTWPGCGILFALSLSAFTNSNLVSAKAASELLALCFGALAIMAFFAQWIQTYVFEIIGERMTRRLRIDYFKALMRQEIGFFDDAANSLGVLTSRLAIDIKLIRLTVGQGTGASLQSLTSLLTGLCAALYGSWQFALAFLSLMPLLVLVELLNWALMQGGDTMAKKQLGNIAGQFGESVQGIREVQSFSLEVFVADYLAVLLKEKIVAQGEKAALFRGISAAAVQIVQMGIYGLIFWVGGKLLDNGTVDYETFQVVLWPMVFGASGMGQAANWVASAAKGKAAAVRVFELFDYKPTIDSKPWNEDGTVRPIRVHNKGKIQGEIELRNVKFAYPTRKTARVFDGLSLKIPAGQTAALIGSSGSGKSTVMSLLERFYDPTAATIDIGGEELVDIVVDTGKADKKAKAKAAKAIEDSTHFDVATESAIFDVDDKINSKNTKTRNDDNGTILLDGVDIRDIDVRYLRSIIGIVGQEPVLFDTTIAENIAFGKDGATREEIISAAKTAHAHGFISNLKDGYDYNVGTRGNKVSGGQKQRIAIARAILKHPKILLLDEATSALDNESEKLVQESLDELMADKSEQRTVIVIAHRLSTVRNADCIYVLENKGDGAVVVESGNHEQLVALGGKYKALLETSTDAE